MRKIKAVIIILGVILTHLCSPVNAQVVKPVVYVEPVTVQIGVGQSVEVAIAIRDVTDLYGMEIHLAFDPQIVEVEDAQPDMDGVQISPGTFLEPGLLLFNEVDNSLGTINFVMSQRNPAEAKSGTGNLLVIRFRGKVSGNSSLDLTQVLLADRNGMALDPDLENGMLQVTTQQPSGPTATALPKGDSSSAILIPTLAPTVEGQPTMVPSQVASTPTPTSNQTNPVASSPTEMQKTGDGQVATTESGRVNEPETTTGTLFTRFGWIIAILIAIIVTLIVLTRKHNIE